jgi:hypothetical protein
MSMSSIEGGKTVHAVRVMRSIDGRPASASRTESRQSPSVASAVQDAEAMEGL